MRLSLPIHRFLTAPRLGMLVALVLVLAAVSHAVAQDEPTPREPGKRLAEAADGEASLKKDLVAFQSWKDREAATNEHLTERLARLRERFEGSARATEGTRAVLKTNRDFVREMRSFLKTRLEPDLRETLDEHLAIRSGIQDRLLQGNMPGGGLAPRAAEPDDHRQALRSWYVASNAVVQVLLDIDGLYAVRKSTLDEMESFVLGHMYWVRSQDPLGKETLYGVVDEFWRIVRAWVDYGAIRGREPWRLTLLSVGFLVLVVGGVFLHRRLSARHSRWNYRGGRVSVIAQRLAANLLLSSVAPVLLLLATLLLEVLAPPAVVSQPVRIALIGLAIILFARRFVGAVFREGGLAVSELQSPPEVAAQLWRANRIATTGLLLVALPWFVLRTFPVDPQLAHMPRILFMVLQVWVAVVLVGLLSRRGALLQETTGGRGFWFRVAAVLGPLVILATAFVLGMDAMGYRYGARLLSVNILQTIAAGIILAGAYNLVTSLLDQSARRYRQKMRPEVGYVEAEELARKHTRQVARLVGVATIGLTVALLGGFWDLGTSVRGIFSSLEIVPAEAAGGVRLTAWSALRAIAWVVGGHFVVANLAGVLHVLLFSRIPGMQLGTRFAIDAVARYALLLIAYAAAILSLHMSFSSLGWALAAVSLGVGFGMQEIVSNFVSGLILLLERPVRVGDVVSVGATTGTVEKIQIRATHILNLDRQVIILPNRKFISEEVVNWTHNDLVIRQTLEVGVAYGTDIVPVRRLLFEIVAGHPKVVKDPPPRVWFRSFGDSALTVQIHVFTEFEYRLQVTNDLNIEISRRFGEEGIEIAFPQRDLHLRSVQDPAVLRAFERGVNVPEEPDPESP